MPKVKPLIRHGPYEKEALEKVGCCMTLLHITQGELARRIGMPPSTLSRRLKNPGEFRAAEMDAITRVLERGA